MVRDYKLNTHINNINQCRYLAKEIEKIRGNGSASVDKLVTVFMDFHEATGVSQLKHLTKEDYNGYIEQLRERVADEAGKKLEMSTVVGRLSYLNTAIETICRTNRITSLDFIRSPSKCDFRRATDTTDKANSPEAAKAWRNRLESQAAAGDKFAAGLRHATELMGAFGLRYREASACKLDDKNSNALYLEVDRKDQTKCGKYRRIEITADSQRQALESAKAFAKQNHMRSLIPADMTLQQCRGRAYREVEKFRDETGFDYRYHGERHEYAHRKYASEWGKLAGHEVQCPAVMGLGGRKNAAKWFAAVQSQTGLSKYQVRELDEKIRLSVSTDLGHGRTDVTATYLG